MKSPGILGGILVAVIVALGAGATGLILGGLIFHDTLLNLILCASSLVYLLYLLKCSSARIGRVVVISSWAAISFACWVFDLALQEQVLIQVGLIWLVRSLYFHGSMITALLDFGLVSAGLAASAWTILNTGSPAAALWSFFLLQALFCWIPEPARKQSGEAFGVTQNQFSFQSAHRVALDAVRKLAQP